MLTAKLQEDERYPKTLKTLGDHLRTVRLNRNLEMKDVAKILGVSTATIYGWEHNRNHPLFSAYASIISFLGYEPEELLSKKSFIENFERYRKEQNLTIYHCATQMKMCSKQLKKLINQEIELSELNKSRIQNFIYCNL